MMTVNEVSKLAGVSIRTLQYYDKIGLLHPAGYSDAGYRLYDDTDLRRLQQILLFRELEFPLKEIGKIIESPEFDHERALKQQIELLTMKRKHLDDLIGLARKIQKQGEYNMEFKAFDTSKIEEYTKKAKESWGDTAEYKEFEKKHGKRSASENASASEALMAVIADFGPLREAGTAVSDPKVQSQVGKLKDCISENFYTCSNETLAGLGKMYAAGGDFTDNIDKAAGEGTAVYINDAIQVYCK